MSELSTMLRAVFVLFLYASRWGLADDKVNVAKGESGVEKTAQQNLVVFRENDRINRKVSEPRDGPEIVVVGTVDGVIHGVDARTGDRIWSSDSVGGPTLRSYQDRSIEGGDIIPGDDGLLYLFSESGELSRQHLSIPDIVDNCPFTEKLESEGKKIRVVGKKKTSFFELDPNTGERLRVFSSEGNSLLHGKWSGRRESTRKHPNAPFEGAPPFTIGRVDYHIRAFDADSGNEIWNFTYAQLLSKDSRVSKQEPGSANNLIKASSSGSIPLRSTWDGLPVTAVFGLSRESGPKSSWAFDFEESIVDQAHEKVSVNPVYLQRINFKSGEQQVFATQEKPGRDLRCNREMFPTSSYGDEGGSSEKDLVSHLDTDTCNAMETDFPFEGPYQVEYPVKRFGPKHAIPAREKHRAMLPLPRYPSSYSPEERNFHILLTILALLLLGLGWNLFRKRYSSTKPGSPRICQFDESTNTERIGSLKVYLSDMLGQGCHGTAVYKGMLEGRPVAVKKVLSSQYLLAKKEIELLIRSDGHPNVVRYFTQESSRDFIYLALELCDATLDKAVAKVKEINYERKAKASKAARKNVTIPSGSLEFLKSLADATHHLHKLKIVHCDIKPQNILVVTKPEKQKNEGGGSECAEEGGVSFTIYAGVGDFYHAKLSDMGLGRKFSDHTSSIQGGSSMAGSGTIGWRAPELLRGLQPGKLERDVAVRCGRKVDVFSLGCVFFYVISGGYHPFGGALEREKNVLCGIYSELENVSHLPEAHSLIRGMIDCDPDARPTMAEVLHHPLLWSSAKKLEFLKHVSDRIEADRGLETVNTGPKAFTTPESCLHEELEKRSEKVFGKQGWLQRLHPLLRQEVVESTRRYYTTHSLRDLLRLIRNKYSHYRESTPEVKQLLSPVPDGFLHQFLGSNRFPHLLVACYELVLDFCAHEPDFAEIIGEPIVARFAAKSKERMQKIEANRSAKDVSKPSSKNWRDGDGTPPTSPVFSGRPISPSRSPNSRAGGLCGQAMPPPLNLSGPPGFDRNRRSPPGFERKGRENGRSPWNSAPASKPKSRYNGDPKLDPNYKTVLCSNWEGSGGTHCHFGDRCFFAHGSKELREKQSEI
mmetsp:Transcript_8888/g.16707  ORF Transcript_8888/g.16707 Transcript_8888/m.16707 type:complete len:1102 (-) Transcript_8888:821-4126(-)